MDPLLPIIGLVLGVLLVNAVATRFSVPPPILLVVVGFVVSFIPGVPGYQVSPELVLAVLLPPLLFAAAFESSAVAIRRLLRPIFQLAVVLVLLTAFTVAIVLTALIPAIPFAAALALGAIVASPDAVTAVAVARRVGMPRRLVTVLEGESLFNDATSLVTLKVAIAAIGASSIAWAPAIGAFAWASCGGVLIGVALGLLLSFIRRTATSALTISPRCPGVPVRRIPDRRGHPHLRGAGGGGHRLVLGYRSPKEVAAEVRLTEGATWAALRFVLEGTVFALIGLQLREIVGSLDTSDGIVFVAIAAVLATVILSRPLWLVPIHLLSRLASERRDHRVAGRCRDLLGGDARGGVAGRGADAAASDPVPIVAAGLHDRGDHRHARAAGLSLPWVIRRLGIVEDHRADDLRERAEAHTRTSTAINDRVDELCAAGQLSDRQAELMRKWAALRDWRNWDDDDRSRDFGNRLSVLSDWRRFLLGIERSVIVGMRDGGELTEEVLREMQHDLDLEEALLERRSDAVDGHLQELPDRVTNR